MKKLANTFLFYLLIFSSHLFENLTFGVGDENFRILESLNPFVTHVDDSLKETNLQNAKNKPDFYQSQLNRLAEEQQQQHFEMYRQLLEHGQHENEEQQILMRMMAEAEQQREREQAAKIKQSLGTFFEKRKERIDQKKIKEKQHLQKQQQQLPLMIENQQSESQEFHPNKKQRQGSITNNEEIASAQKMPQNLFEYPLTPQFDFESYKNVEPVSRKASMNSEEKFHEFLKQLETESSQSKPLESISHSNTERKRKISSDDEIISPQHKNIVYESAQPIQRAQKSEKSKNLLEITPSQKIMKISPWNPKFSPTPQTIHLPENFGKKITHIKSLNPKDRKNEMTTRFFDIESKISTLPKLTENEWIELLYRKKFKNFTYTHDKQKGNKENPDKMKPDYWRCPNRGQCKGRIAIYTDSNNAKYYRRTALHMCGMEINNEAKVGRVCVQSNKQLGEYTIKLLCNDKYGIVLSIWDGIQKYGEDGVNFLADLQFCADNNFFFQVSNKIFKFERKDLDGIIMLDFQN